MKTSKEIEAEFRADLKALLKKYKATISLEDYSGYYNNHGENLKIAVTKQSIYDECSSECVEEYTEFDLGRWIDYK